MQPRLMTYPTKTPNAAQRRARLTRRFLVLYYPPWEKGGRGDFSLRGDEAFVVHGRLTTGIQPPWRSGDALLKM